MSKRIASILPKTHTELSDVLAGSKRPLLAVAAFGGLCNMLFLTGSFFMLQVYDRVLPSRSLWQRRHSDQQRALARPW